MRGRERRRQVGGGWPPPSLHLLLFWPPRGHLVALRAVIAEVPTLAWRPWPPAALESGKALRSGRRGSGAEMLFSRKLLWTQTGPSRAQLCSGVAARESEGFRPGGCSAHARAHRLPGPGWDPPGGGGTGPEPEAKPKPGVAGRGRRPGPAAARRRHDPDPPTPPPAPPRALALCRARPRAPASPALARTCRALARKPPPPGFVSLLRVSP